MVDSSLQPPLQPSAEPLTFPSDGLRLSGAVVPYMHRRRKRRAGSLIGLHATLAISAFVVLAAYLFA